jgi:site-specific recombinase XerD
VTSLTHRERRPAAGWRTSTHSSTAHPPACLEAARGRWFGGVFIIDPPAAPAVPAASSRTTATVRPVTAVRQEATSSVRHRRLPSDVVRSSYPWLSKINPLHSRGGDFATNCVLAAIGTDLTLKEAMLDPDEDPALRAYYQVSPSERAPREHIRNLGKGEPVPVPGYTAITDAMTKAGHGARGIVIVDRHVFNVVHDENGVVFLDGQKGRQAVLPARFRSLEFLRTSDGIPRESIAVNTTPGQPYPFLGAYSLELETGIIVHGLPPEVEGTSGFVLAVNKRLGYQVKIDNRPFFRDTELTYYPTHSHFAQSGKKLGEQHDWSVVEFVPMPFGVTGQPHDTRAADRATVMASMREKLKSLLKMVTEHPDHRPQLPAQELFPVEEGWELYPAQEGWDGEWAGAADTTLDILPITAPGGESLVLYPQYTAGVPLTEMHEFLKYTLTQAPYEGVVQILSDGLDFGDELAQRFVEWRFGVTVPRTSLDTLGEIESVAAIRGMTALVFPHIVAQMVSYLYPQILTKNFLVVASRVAFAGIRQQLSGDAKTFLAQHAQPIRDSLLNRFRLAWPDYERPYYEQARIHREYHAFAKRLPDGRIDLLSLPIPDNAEGMTIGNYLDNALLDRPAQRVDQTDGIGMLTQFDEADTNEGRLTVALIPVELRGFGPYPAGIHDAEEALTSIDDVLGPMYDQAQHRLGGIDQARIDALLAVARTPVPTSGGKSRPLPTPPARTPVPTSGGKSRPLPTPPARTPVPTSGGKSELLAAAVSPSPMFQAPDDGPLRLRGGADDRPRRFWYAIGRARASAKTRATVTRLPAVPSPDAHLDERPRRPFEFRDRAVWSYLRLPALRLTQRRRSGPVDLRVKITTESFTDAERPVQQETSALNTPESKRLQERAVADWIAGLDPLVKERARQALPADTDQPRFGARRAAVHDVRVHPAEPSAQVQSMTGHVGEWSDTNTPAGHDTARPGSAAGSPADALAKLIWNESSHSLPPDPNDANAVKACVSVAVVNIAPRAGPVTPQISPVTTSLKEAVESFLARRDLDADSLRSYGQTLHRLCQVLGNETSVAAITAEQVGRVVADGWGGGAARTWNRHRAAVRSFTTWATGRGFLAVDLAALLEYRPPTRDQTRAIDRRTIIALLKRRDVPLREKTLWTLLYESAARADSILALDIEDLDLENKRGRITAKGNVVRWVHWQSGTARRLPRLIADRTRGPLFLGDRRPAPARTPTAADLCPITGRGRLSYERAEYLFKQATITLDPGKGGYTLHQLRHSRLTHLAEDGWSAPMLMGLSGHENIRSLAIYTNITPDALAEHDPARRHR